jgi:hypothetical protein
MLSSALELSQRSSVPTIEVNDETYQQLAFAARVFGVDIAEVVARLMVNMAEATDASETKPETGEQVVPGEEEVRVHAVYQSRRVTGVFQRSTNQLRVTSEPLANRLFSSPSAAAVAVVEKLNPGREFPHTNGRTFWIVDNTGRTLRSIIGRR